MPAIAVDEPLSSIDPSKSDVHFSYGGTLGEMRFPMHSCALPDGTFCLVDGDARGLIMWTEPDSPDDIELHHRLRIITPAGKHVRCLRQPDLAFPMPTALHATRTEKGDFLYVMCVEYIFKVKLPSGDVVAEYSVWKPPKAKGEPRQIRLFDPIPGRSSGMPMFGGAVTRGDNLYVADINCGRILVFSASNLAYRRSFGTLGDREKPSQVADTEFLLPKHLALHPEGLLIADQGARNFKLWSATGDYVRTYDYWGEQPEDTEGPLPALYVHYHEGMTYALDGSRLLVLDGASGALVRAVSLCAVGAAQSPNMVGMHAANGTLYVCEYAPTPTVHTIQLTVPAKPDAAPDGDVSAARPAPFDEAAWGGEYDVDAVCIGGGIVGCICARDIASSGYKVLIVEAEDDIGGVWFKNRYPGLRLHAPGYTYRSLSLAPEWQKAGDGVGHPEYRPYQSEILAYFQSLPLHENITVRTGVRMCNYHRLQGAGWVKGLDTGSWETTCDKLVARSRVLFATGAYETTSGKPWMPINAADVTNGAQICHSSALVKNLPLFQAAKRRFLVGASKAAIDILQSQDPKDDGFHWIHRGHVIFARREFLEAGIPSGGMPVWSQEAVEANCKSHVTSMSACRKFKFDMYDQLFKMEVNVPGVGKISRGNWVGEPITKGHIAARGGVEQESCLAHARLFLPKQRILARIFIEKGALTFLLKDGSKEAVSADDYACLCTGQRNDMGGESWTWQMDAAHQNKDGLLRAVPLSGTAPCIATYMSYMAVWYLDGKKNNYTNGKYHQALVREAALIAKAGNKNPWALFMAYLGAIQAMVSDTIFPLLSVGAGDMSGSPWFLEWYGKDMNFREVASKLAAPAASMVPPDEGQ